MTLIFQSLIWFGLFGLSIFSPVLGGLGLLLGYTLADKLFALINIGQLIHFPLFITEPVLIVLLIHAVIISYREDRLRQWRDYLKSPWFWFYSIGILNIFFGLLFNGLVLVLRDAVIVFYGFIAQLTFIYVRKMSHIKKIFFVVLGGLALRLILENFSDVFSHEASAFGMYAAFIILSCICTMPLWDRFKPAAFITIMILMGVIAATEIRTVWVAVFIGLLFIIGIHLTLRIPLKSLAMSSVAILSSVILTASFLKLSQPQHYKLIKLEFLSMFAGKDTPNLMTRVAMWEDAIEEVVPATGRIFAVFDRKVLNPYLFDSETRPSSVANVEILKDDAPSATNILESYEIASPEIVNLYQEPESTAVSEPEQKPAHLEASFDEMQKEIIQKIERDSVSEPEQKSAHLEASFDEMKVVAGASGKAVQEKNALKKFIGKSNTLRLLFGVPFGKAFIPERISPWHRVNRYDPHNSFIAILYRTGIVGFVLFFMIIGQIFFKSFKNLKKLTNSNLKYYFLAVMSCLVYHMGHSLTDVTLENPFRGVPFWLLLGLLMVLNSMGEKQSKKVVNE